MKRVSLLLLLGAFVLLVLAGYGLWRPKEPAFEPRAGASRPDGVPETSATALPDVPDEQTTHGTGTSLPHREWPTALSADFDLQLEGFAAAQIGMDAVLARLGALTEARKRESFLRGVFRLAATLDVPLALEWMKRLPPGEAQDVAGLTLLSEWSDRTTSSIAGGRHRSNFGAVGTLGMYLLTTHRATPEQVAAMANDLLRGSDRTALLTEAAAVLAVSDPARAFALGDGLAGAQQMQFLRGFAEGWGTKDANAAWDWAARMPNEMVRAELLSDIIEVEAQTDLQAAAQHFLALDPGSPARPRVVEEIASQWASVDTAEAIRWADSLPSDAERVAAQKGIQAVAPVGIGAVLATGEDGVAVITELVPGGAASRAGALQAGDRVLAVSDANGAWVDTRQLPLGELVKVIRGAPDTVVSLQVQPANGAPARTVTLARQQITHKRP